MIVFCFAQVQRGDGTWLRGAAALAAAAAAAAWQTRIHLPVRLSAKTLAQFVILALSLYRIALYSLLALCLGAHADAAGGRALALTLRSTASSKCSDMHRACAQPSLSQLFFSSDSCRYFDAISTDLCDSFWQLPEA
jgi:hypothetical protein